MDVLNDAQIFDFARSSQRRKVFNNNGVQLVRMRAGPIKPVHPDSIAREQVVKGTVETLEIDPYGSFEEFVSEGRRRLVEPRIGPAVVIGHHREVLFHKPEDPILAFTHALQRFVTPQRQGIEARARKEFLSIGCSLDETQ